MTITEDSTTVEDPESPPEGRRFAKASTYLKMSPGGTAGEFEAVVAVYGNIDHDGDRILPGAFQASLDRWKASGDPIPVIFSHLWKVLDAHIGVVLDAADLAPGDPRLPSELSANGGLWIKARLDMDEDYASRVWRKMDRRSIKEFSFAYDIVDARRASDGANELVVLDVIEVGPALKGANPFTVLTATKTAEAGAKMRVDMLAGTLEERIGMVRAAAQNWALAEYGDDLYFVHSEGTFETSALVVAERWEDPIGAGQVWSLQYELGEADGEMSAEIVAAVEQDVEITLTAKDWADRKAKAEAETGKSKDATTDPGEVVTLEVTTTEQATDQGKASPTGEAEAEVPNTGEADGEKDTPWLDAWGVIVDSLNP